MHRLGFPSNYTLWEGWTLARLPGQCHLLFLLNRLRLKSCLHNLLWSFLLKVETPSLLCLTRLRTALQPSLSPI